MTDKEFLNAVNWARSNDRTAYHCIQACVLMFSVAEHGRMVLNSQDAIELRSLPKSEHVKMLNRSETMSQANPSTAAHFKAVSEFIRSALMKK
jgi:hypothetical protein